MRSRGARPRKDICGVKPFLRVLAFLVALVAFLFGNGLVAGFMLIAGVLLGSALLLPLVLASILRLGEKRAHGAVAQWFWADSRQQLSGLSLALMALLLALSTNVGVGTMVDGISQNFCGMAGSAIGRRSLLRGGQRSLTPSALRLGSRSGLR